MLSKIIQLWEYKQDVYNNSNNSIQDQHIMQL